MDDWLKYKQYVRDTYEILGKDIDEIEEYSAYIAVGYMDGGNNMCKLVAETEKDIFVNL